MHIEQTGFCFRCNKQVNFTVSTRIVGNEVNYEESMAHCKICGGLVFVPGIADMNCYRRLKAIMEAEK